MTCVIKKNWVLDDDDDGLLVDSHPAGGKKHFSNDSLIMTWDSHHNT